MDGTYNGSMMQRRIEAMLGSQLFAICALQDENERLKTQIAQLEAEVKRLTPKKATKKSGTKNASNT